MVFNECPNSWVVGGVTRARHGDGFACRIGRVASGVLKPDMWVAAQVTPLGFASWLESTVTQVSRVVPIAFVTASPGIQCATFLCTPDLLQISRGDRPVDSSSISINSVWLVSDQLPRSGIEGGSETENPLYWTRRPRDSLGLCVAGRSICFFSQVVRKGLLLLEDEQYLVLSLVARVPPLPSTLLRVTAGETSAKAVHTNGSEASTHLVSVEP